ncbi:MAG: FAD-dependent oxidoreductase [Clostridia bacterium]|nr:FAD-dependent oxidoreductase [Clostridia bacterium]
MEKIDVIMEKANWCLGCKAKPCSKGCPMNTNIPEFIREIKKNNFEEAYRILIENNIFSHICSIVCPQEEQCEGACIRGIKQTSTEIGFLERFVNEWAEENDTKIKFECKKKNGKKVAVIGSGPAGLECSFELIKNGFDVTVFEKDKDFGGVPWYGIPDFRLDKKLINNIIGLLKENGVVFKNNIIFGSDITIESLKNDFDAIFIGIGAEKPSLYSLGDFDRIYDSDTFLRAYNNKEFIENLGKTVIIGGGNVAMDSARAAIRMGADEVSILYRRDREHMPAREIELEDALNDGVKDVFTTRVINGIGNGRKLDKLNCIKTEVIDSKAIDIVNSEFEYEANSVVFAIGLKPNKDLIESQGIEVNDWKMINVDENGETNIENVFAGGDCVESKSTVCRALGGARRAAHCIIERFG